MARAHLDCLDKEEEDLIHEQSLKSLKEIGIMVRSPSVLKILDDSGANVDHKNMIAQLPESMVNDAIDKAPKSIRLCGLDSKYDLELPVEGIPYVGTNGIGTYMTDLETGEKRTTTRKDIADFARLTDALEGMDFFWSNVTAYDVPEFFHMVYALWVSFQNCRKNYGGLTLSSMDAHAQVELASLIVGGEDELKKRPIFHNLSCIVAPLSFERGAVEGQVELARAGIPIVSMSMSLGGVSCPVTLASIIVNANAENLGSLVITQSAAPGAPQIYCSESSVADMKTGAFAYGTPEYPLIAAASGQMAKRYGLPSYVGGWGMGGEKPGILSPFSEAIVTTLNMLANTDMAAGAGSIDEAKGGSLEQVVIDSYIWENVRGFLRNFTVSEEKIALDVIKKVGHGNTFLTHPHTAKNFKKELFFRDKKKLAWEATLSDHMVPEARAVVKQILNEHEVPQLDRDIIKHGDELIKKYEKSAVRS